MSYVTLISILSACNGFDTAASLWVVLSGKATEANPLMASLMSFDPVIFVIVKFTSVTAAGIFLSIQEYKRALEYLTLIYCLLIWWHIFGVFA